MTFRVKPDDAGLTLLAFLRKHFKEAPSVKAIKRAIDAKHCTVGGRIERFSTRRLKVGDVVAVELPPEAKLSFLYEDDALLICNKPAGIPCEPKFFPARLVHRLDKETSGALLLAKTEAVRRALISLFEQKKVVKWYLAVVEGAVKKKEGTITSRLSRKGDTYASSRQGRLAITRWWRLGTLQGRSVLLCMPVTGRTHQIRVHLKEMGHPVVGDAQYGSVGKRHLLHAWRLEFPHPKTGKKIEVEAPLPSEAFEMAHFVELAHKQKEKYSRDERRENENIEEFR